MSPRAKRRYLAPEIIQTSAMDCGPAVLQCILSGFGIPASYGRLRDACQTEVDGTSIDRLEDMLVQLGFEAEQILVPKADVLLDGDRGLPAIAVVQAPTGAPHFVVAWRLHGPLIQVMDPSGGRRVLRTARFVKDLFTLTMRLPAEKWRTWATSDGATGIIRARLAAAKIAPEDSEKLLSSSLDDPTWRTIATLDAAARMVESLVRSRALSPGSDARAFIASLISARSDREVIPPNFWSVEADLDDDSQLLVTGAVLVRVTSLASSGPSADLPPEVERALEERPAAPWRALFERMFGGAWAPALLASGIGLAAAATVFEALIFRGFVDMSAELKLPVQRLTAMAIMIALLTVLGLFDAAVLDALLVYGRRLEVSLRVAFLEKVPKLGRYFRTRPSSDMAERLQGVHRLRQVPHVAADLVRSGAGIITTTIGVVWLAPGSALQALLVSVAAISLPLLGYLAFAEHEMRLRTHTGALFRFYLDAQLGLAPIRSHSAERSIRNAHAGVLADWLEAGTALLRISLLVDAVSAVIAAALMGWLLVDYLGTTEVHAGMLLVVYWTLQIGILGRNFSWAVRRFPPHRNNVVRLLEPLGAMEEAGSAADPAPPIRGGAAIEIRGVTVQAGGHTVLEEIDLEISPCSHVAIVGRSGAGKSSLVGLLLGTHLPSVGRVMVDGSNLDATRISRLRRDTAWVDPTVRLWNATLLENILYGSTQESVHLGEAISEANLRDVLERLDSGLQTQLGEGGALLSGGEGQRVRLGRALLRDQARLVILDEPFRGLDRPLRSELLQRSRQWWADATLLCITHDVRDTLSFERAIVVEDGRIVEDGAPSDLVTDPGSRYAQLLAHERALAEVWQAAYWRFFRVEDGSIVESDRRIE